LVEVAFISGRQANDVGQWPGEDHQECAVAAPLKGECLMSTRNHWLALVLAALSFAAGVACSMCVAQQAPAPQPDKAALQKLVQSLGSDDFSEREQAGKRLVAAGEGALEVLRSAAKSPDAEVRSRAEACIKGIERQLKEIERTREIARLVAQLQARTNAERVNAAQGLFKNGRRIELVPALIGALDDTDPKVREKALGLLGSIGPGAKAAVPRLVALAEDAKATDEDRIYVAHVLSCIGDDASTSIPCLFKLVKSKNMRLANFAIKALGAVGKKHDAEVVPVLLSLLKSHENLDIQANAAAALGMINKQPAIAVPAIVDLLRKHKSFQEKGKDDPRVCILLGLGKFGRHAKPAVPILIELLNDPREEKVWSYIIWALTDIGPEAKEAVPALLKLKEDRINGAIHRQGIAQALEAIQSKSR